MDIHQITNFVGWCAVINMFFLTLATLFLYYFRSEVINIHYRLTGIKKDTLTTLYFTYLGNYKISIFMFNVVPYLALKIMT